MAAAMVQAMVLAGAVAALVQVLALGVAVFTCTCAAFLPGVTVCYLAGTDRSTAADSPDNVHIGIHMINFTQSTSTIV